ncbi:glycosyltransferase family 2 protein [Methylocystis sp. JAN1]|uniref:glycosyltransferase family 2 protein n=1 Tax=Methylocystis sp. JAN1 TaxID=3397211 RepID=UPI003FA2FF95
MSQRVFVWRGPQSENEASRASILRLDGLEVVPVDWSESLEAFVAISETPLHISDAGHLEGRWIAFLDPDFFSEDGRPLAVMLDYARFYGLRTVAAIETTRALRPESFALEAVIANGPVEADRLRGGWRALGLDIAFAPPVIVAGKGADAPGLGELLDAIPPVASLVLLEGSRSPAANLAMGCAEAGVAARRLKWNEPLAALLPIEEALAAQDFSNAWAVLSLPSCRDGAEAMVIIDMAKGLGLKTAIVVGDYALDQKYGRLPLQGADLVLFETTERRDAALQDAFRFDEKIALLRDRWRIASDITALLREVSMRRSKLNAPRLLQKPVRIAFAGLKDAQEEAALREALQNLGIASDRHPPKSAADWVLLGAGAMTHEAGLLADAKAVGARIAAIAEGADASIVETLDDVDVILPTGWEAAAEIVRASALAGKSGAKVIPCPAPGKSDRSPETVDWSGYAARIVSALSAAAAPPGWPRPAVLGKAPRPLLTCAITTYNRAPWLRHSLKLLLEAAAPWRDKIEVLVCDNASTDDTPRVAEELLQRYDFAYHRNPVNVGMLGNLGATARRCKGDFVWIIGDDDLVVAEGLKTILDSIENHPDIEMVYLNYGFTHFNEPESLREARRLVENAQPIGFGGPDRYARKLADVAAFNENLFTAIYACVFRRDHALRAYQLDTRGAPFSSLATCVPSSVYTLSALADRPAYWIGFPSIVVNMNVSWLRWALLWHLERMPDLHDMAELAGVDPDRIDRHRFKHCWNAGEWLREALFDSEDAIRAGVSVARLIERCRHLPVFKDQEGAKVAEVYRKAWEAGRAVADHDPPETLFSRYGNSHETEIATAEEK